MNAGIRKYKIHDKTNSLKVTLLLQRMIQHFGKVVVVLAEWTYSHGGNRPHLLEFDGTPCWS